MEPKLKVNKHGNNRLPDAFIQPRNISHRDKDKKNIDKLQIEKDKKVINDEKEQRIEQVEEKKDNKGKKKSRNPFLPMREWFKLSKEFQSEFESRISELKQMERYSFENNLDVLQKEEIKEHKIKHEDCLTLNVIRKTQTFCLKKILHVPTLTIFFLRESLIDSEIDKTDLEQWINKCNSSQSYNRADVKPQRIIQLYWNVPETYYSIIYEYNDGVLFDFILENTSILPIQFIQNLTMTHLKADFLIYNSILIVKKSDESEICYLPVYEEIDDIVPQYRNFKELLKIDDANLGDQNMLEVERRMIAKLGFLALVAFFSDVIVDEDIANIYCQNVDCCLFHKQMGDSQSLLKIFFDGLSISPLEKDIISDFFCRTLKFKPSERASFAELIKHKFIKSKFPSGICKMSEIIQTLESAGSTTKSSKSRSKELSIHKMNKLIDAMCSIKQGVPENEQCIVELESSNVQIRYLIDELGFGSNEDEKKKYTEEMIKKLRRVYEN